MLGTLVAVPHTYGALHKSWTSQKGVSFKMNGSQHGERSSGRLMRAHLSYWRQEHLLLCGDKGGSLPHVQPYHRMHSCKLPKLKTLACLPALSFHKLPSPYWQSNKPCTQGLLWSYFTGEGSEGQTCPSSCRWEGAQTESRAFNHHIPEGHTHWPQWGNNPGG